MLQRAWLKWLAAVALALLALIALPLAWGALFGWNWARAPLQTLVLQRTGRALHIGGKLDLAWGWPALQVRAQALSFANPAWAAAPQMLTADRATLNLDLRQLLHGRLAFIDVRLTQPRVFLEQASGGRRNWLLDRAQTDEGRRIPIGRLLLDRGELHYVDRTQRTDLQARLSTVDAPALPASAPGGAYDVAFTASGQYRGQRLEASGRGGAVLALADESRPYPLAVDIRLGATRVRARGTVTSLLKFTALDLQLALQGDDLAALYPVLGLALPPTPAYTSSGHLVRSGRRWRYEAFTGRVGRSDIAGTLQVDTGGPRPRLSGALTSQRLALADLGPSVGARNAAAARPHATVGAASAPAPAGAAHVLPDLPFDTARWAGLDADVTLRAQTLLRDKALPLEDLQLHLLLKNAVLTLDPLDFGLAGGHLRARVTLDGQAQPLRGRIRMQLRGLQLGRLLPTVDLSKTSIGLLAGDVALDGSGASVGRMLADADGRISLVAQNGRISRLLMEQIGLHLLEIARLTLTGDDNVRLRCAVADFGVARGVMNVRALVVDTDVTTLVGSGSIDLAHETLNLTIVPHTKRSSLVGLRGPLYVKGSFGRPVIAFDTARIAARGAGALALGLLNPLLALIPLFDAGPGRKSECVQLVAEAHRGAATRAPRAMPASAAAPR
ncbi:MAG: AsmA family protein [Burkholderiales bacterium]|nr:AsmA family protein [Burkholderiales bacterium]